MRNLAPLFLFSACVHKPVLNTSVTTNLSTPSEEVVSLPLSECSRDTLSMINRSLKYLNRHKDELPDGDFPDIVEGVKDLIDSPPPIWCLKAEDTPPSSIHSAEAFDSDGDGLADAVYFVERGLLDEINGCHFPALISHEFAHIAAEQITAGAYDPQAMHAKIKKWEWDVVEMCGTQKKIFY